MEKFTIKTRQNELSDIRDTDNKPLGKVGDIFGTWEILEETRKPNSRQIYLKCRCIDCGNTKVYVKSLLTRQTPCCECGSKSVLEAKKDLIERRYDKLLNRLPINKILAKSSYWWRCEKGHSYRKRVIELTEKCPICEEEEHFDEIMEHRKKSYDDLYIYTKHLFDNIFVDEKFSINKLEDMMAIRIFNKDYNILMFPDMHNTYKPILHGDLDTFYKIQNTHRDLLSVYTEKINKEVVLTLRFRYDMILVSNLIVSILSENNKNEDKEYMEKLKSRLEEVYGVTL